MRMPFGALAALALAVGVASVAGPPGAAAQGGGTIEAEVRYRGAPLVERVKIGKDTEKCGTEATIEKIVVGANRELAHAVVSLAGTVNGGAARAARPAIEQKGCQFTPHVVAMQVGEIDIRNRDEILHNVHTFSTANPPINKAQPKFKKVLTERFDKPEVVKIGCDIHGWMLAWVAVLPHPYFGVTDASGRVRIEHVPAGRHTVEVWHEVLGKQTREVDVRAGQVVRVSVEMRK